MSKVRSIGSKNDFELLLCTNCESIYTTHLPDELTSENYDDYYSEENLTAPEFITVRVSEIVGGFSEFRQTNHFLDVGFGAGTLLHAAKIQQWDVFGLEVSKPAVEQAKKFGYQVFHGDLNDAAYPDNHFDVITASEILEHLMDPQSFLKEVNRILRPGGLFWATTPSARSLSFRLLKHHWSILSPPEHVQLYSKKAIKLMFKDAGFDTVRVRTFGLNPMEIIQHYRRNNNSVTTFNRVESSYQLNESLTKSPVRKAIKNFLNQTLDFLQVGDSLKIFARTKT